MTDRETPTPSGFRPWKLLNTTLGPLLALGLVILFFMVADNLQADGGTFSTVRNVQAIATQTATVAVAALGMTIIIIAGGIDLSAGTAIALCAVVLAWSLKADLPVVLVHGESEATARENLAQAGRQQEQIERKLSSAVDPPEALRSELAAAEKEVTRRTARLEEIQAVTPHLRKWSAPLALIITLGVGAAAGFLNGLLVSSLRVIPFIVTLGTMQLYLGISKYMADETTVRPARATQVPPWISELLSLIQDASYFGLPLGVWLTLLLALILSGVLRYTVFGRYVFALGSNEATARLCGIHVSRNKIAVYTLAGLFVGMAGIYQFSRLSVGNPTSGIGLELRVIAAVVIGGGSLNGGRGSVLGTLTGAAIMTVITAGCTQLGLRNPVQDMILGIIIVAAVAFDQLRGKHLSGD